MRGRRGRNKARSTRRCLIAALVVMTAFFAYAGTARATTNDGGSTSAPWITSDQSDYPPGSTVHLTGGDWQPGESVHILTNDSVGNSWSQADDVTADSYGNVADDVVLPTSFTAQYTVTATGDLSGTATATFTDGNVKFDAAPTGNTATFVEHIFPNSTTCSGAEQTNGGFPKTLNNSAGDTVGVGSTQSMRIDAAGSSDQGGAFSAWSSTDSPGSPFTVISGTAGKSICIAGFQNGTRNYRATYAVSANHAPTVAADNASVTTPEGSNATNTGTWSDADAGDTVTLSASVGTVTKSGTNAAGTWSWSFGTTDGPAGPTTVTITANDGHTSTSTSFTFSVTNVAPTATFNAPTSVNEGSAISLSLTSPSDPSSADTTAGFTYAFDCGSGYGSFGASSSTSCPTTDNGSRTVKGKIQDKDGGVTEYTASVAINNVAPTATLSNTGPVNEGSAATISFSSPSDPSSADTTAGFHYAYSCTNGDLSGATYANTAGSTASTSCTFDDGPSDPVVKARIIDKDGGFTEYTTTVHVNNVAPTATISNDAPKAEGAPVTVSLSSPSDPSSADTSAGFHYAFSCSNGDLSGATYAGSGTSASTTCSYAAGGSRTVKVRIIDKDGGYSEYSTTFTINNVAPSVTLSGATSANEGDSKHYNFSITDPGSGTESYSISADSCGSGNALSNATINSSTGAGSFDCTFDDGPSSPNVSVSVSDGTDTGSDSKSVTVANVGPTATLSNDGPKSEGAAVTISFSGQTDPSNADTTAGFHYAYSCSDGDLSGATYAGSGTAASTTCSFAGDGTRIVKARIIDKDGGYSEYSTTFTVDNVAPSVTLSGPTSANEGDSKHYTFSITDPGTGAGTGAETYSISADSCGSGNALSGETIDSSTGSGSFDCLFDDGASSPTVSVTVSDGTDTGSDSKSVTVANVGPTASLGNSGPVNEGSPATISFSSQSDPSGADTSAGFRYEYNCDGSAFGPADYSSASTSDSTQCTFSDNGTYTVRARIIDKDNGSTEYTTDVQVDNVAPTADLANSGPVNEGSPATISFSNQFDPSLVDTAAGFHYEYSCDGSAFGAADYSTADSSPSHQCTFDDGPSTHTVRARIIDKDNGFTTYTTAVTVNNVAPTADLSSDTPVDEGSPATITFSNQADPSSTDTSAGFHYAYDCDNGDLSGATYANSSASATTQCTYNNGPSDHTVVARIIDKDGGYTERTTQVHVRNVAPAITAPSAQSSNEGENHSFDLGSFSDPGFDSPWNVSVDWGDGSAVDQYQITGSGAASDVSIGPRSHTYIDGPNDYTVTVTVTDPDNGSDTKTFPVHVNNVAPTVTLDPNNDTSVDEGTTHTYKYSVSDPGANDSFTVDPGYPQCGANGQFTGTQTTTTHGGSFDCYFPNGPANSDVKVKVTDNNGGSDAGSQDVQVVQVANVPPTITAPVDQSSTEGSSHSFDLGSFSDPGEDSPWSVSVDWGDGSPTTGYMITGTGAASDVPIGPRSHTYDDGPNDYTVSVTVSDPNGGSDTKTFAVHVDNVDPTATLANSGPVDEGSAATVSFSDQADPSGADTTAGFHYAYACNNGDLSGATYANTAGNTDTTSCTYDDGPSTHTVRARIIDKDGGYSEYTTLVTVNNVAPTADLSNSSPVDEGSPATVSFSNQADPSGADTSAGFRYEYNCDGSTFGSPADYSSASTSDSTQCTFSDNGTYTVRARIIDKDGGSTSHTTDVVVNNVAPSITAPSDQSSHEGENHAFDLGSFSDPGSDSPWHVTVDWGDGSAASSYAINGTGSANDVSIGPKAHTYADGPNDYTVSVTVTDKDGGSDTKTFSVHVNNVAPTVTYTAAPATADEGQTKTYTYSVTDPGVNDTFTVDPGYPNCGDHGNIVGIPTVTATGGSFQCNFPDGPNTTDVAIKVTDSDGGSDTASKAVQIVAVANVPPTVTAPSNQTSNEGENHSFDLGTFSDPGTDSPWSVSVDWGDGGSDSYQITGTGAASGVSIGPKHHVYDDGPADYTVTVTVTDKNGGSDSKAFSVHVDNVAPTALLSNSGPVAEGSPVSVSFTGQSDPSNADTTAGFHYAYDCNNGDLSAATYANTAGNSAISSCTFDDGPSDHTVVAQIIDKDGGYTEYTTSVHVLNAAPTASLTNDGPVNEGSPTTITFGSQHDPSSADTTAGFHYEYHCDGSAFGSTADYSSADSSASHQCTFNDNGTYTVNARIIDKDGGSTSHTTDVVVNNVKPSITAPATQSSNEGESHAFDVGSFNDPGSDSPWHVTVDWGDGSPATTYDITGSGAASDHAIGPRSHTYADGPNNYTVSVTVTDKDGGSDSETFAVQVNNVAPTATFGNDGPVNEGSSFHLALTNPSDPSSADTGAGFTYAFDCGDGGGYGSFGSSNSTTCPTNDSGTRSVKGEIRDKDGGVREYSATVTVNNVAPTATFSNDGPVNEGSSFHLALTNPSDPSSADTSAGFTYAFDCGSGSYGAYGSSNTATCPTSDNGTLTVRGKIQDKDGGYTEYSGTVTVNNVAPTVTITSPSFGSLYAKTATTNPSVTVTASFTDPGTADTHTCSIAWDDGTTSTGTVSESNGSGTCTATHTFTAADVYTFTVTVTDDEGGAGTAVGEVVVYDASAGFVTGGGWINVQAGSYLPNTTLAGRANFGFTSQYKKGATVPTGNTEFQFQVANLNFHSENFSWLVVSGYKAQFKGSGTINGAGNYDFTLTAYDGDIGGNGQTGYDRFRIVISDHATGTVVFDNRVGASMDMDSANPQNISGGSIVIHKA